MGGLDHDEAVSSPEIGEWAVAVQRGEIVEERLFEFPWPCDKSIMGSSRPVTGAETRICKSTARST